MKISPFTVTIALAFLGSVPLVVHAQMSPAAVQAVESYFDFADYNSGTIMAQQIPAEDYPKLLFLDVRDAGQFTKEHIPGALNIEWRQVFAQRSSLPKDKTIVVYCNTGSFSGQVAMSLRMDGIDNVRILHGGYETWKASGGMDAYARTTSKNPPLR